MPQAHTFGSPFDQPRQIRQYETVLRIQSDHSQHRGQSREVVGCHFRTGSGNPGHNAGFPHTGITYHPHIRQHLQFQPEPAFGPRFSFFCKSHSLLGAGHIAGIAFATPAAPGRYEAISWMGQICQSHSGGIIIHHRSQRDLYFHFGSLGSGTVLGCSIAAPLGYELPLVTEVHQGVQVFVRYQDYGTAPPAISWEMARVISG